MAGLMARKPKDAQTSDEAADPRPEEKPPAPDPLGGIHQSIAELLNDFRYYVAARIDAIKFAIKRRIFIACFIAVAALAAAGAIVTGVVLLCAGISDGLAELLGRRWAGELATGALLLSAVALGGYLVLGRLIRRSHRRVVAKYEEMRRDHRERFGPGGAAKTESEDGHE
jgi:hypothetical protein